MSTFDGPFSVTLHIPNNENLNVNLMKLKHFITENFLLLEYKVDIHLVIDKYPRQLNYLRNVARFFCRTELILPLDVDFIVNRSFLPTLMKNDFVKQKLSSGEGVFILPAFEFQDEWVNTKFEQFPQTKKEVVSMFGKNITIFHGKKNKGHTSTRYSKWLTSQEVYQIQPDTIRYEPYAVFNTTTVPWSDERFTGYGGNKAAWWYEIYLAGLEFYILPNDFVIHCYHGYPDVRTTERHRNTPILNNFVDEICKRYAIMFGTRGKGVYEMMGC
ncbi:hypothetical protein HDU92_005330 [Lobulomyces angularis]|nr:hypothetical protein HDU92_005330 [Lobulomyces angularis]